MLQTRTVYLLSTETLQGVVDLLPLALQYPEITCVRIVFGGQEFKTENFGKRVSTQTANIVHHFETEMVLEVGYLEQRPEADEGPFLKEERRLINTIAEGLSALIHFKLVDGELKQSDERFRRAINATEDGLWEWDIQTNQEFFSSRWCEIIGYSFDDHELPHSYISWASRIHPDDYDFVMNALNSHLAKGTKYDVEYRHQHKSGEYRWQHSKGEAVLDESGKPTKMVGCISDITQRKRMEDELRISEEKFRKAFHNCPVYSPMITGRY